MSAQSDSFHDYSGGIFQEQNHHDNKNHSRSTSLIIGLTRAARGVERRTMRWCLSGGEGIGGLLTDGWILADFYWCLSGGEGIGIGIACRVLVLVGWGRYWWIISRWVDYLITDG